jgi:hypothetical protein
MYGTSNVRVPIFTALTLTQIWFKTLKYKSLDILKFRLFLKDQIPFGINPENRNASIVGI